MNLEGPQRHERSVTVKYYKYSSIWNGCCIRPNTAITEVATTKEWIWTSFIYRNLSIYIAATPAIHSSEYFVFNHKYRLGLGCCHRGGKANPWQTKKNTFAITSSKNYTTTPQQAHSPELFRKSIKTSIQAGGFSSLININVGLVLSLAANRRSTTGMRSDCTADSIQWLFRTRNK